MDNRVGQNNPDNPAKFKCLNCGHTWSDHPGPTECPKCKHLYVEWTNYEEWRKRDHERVPERARRVD
jgi:hypothetical protein